MEARKPGGNSQPNVMKGEAADKFDMAKAESELDASERKLAEAVAKLAPAGDGLAFIETRIHGTFEGWNGETIFKMENGRI